MSNAQHKLSKLQLCCAATTLAAAVACSDQSPALAQPGAGDFVTDVATPDSYPKGTPAPTQWDERQDAPTQPIVAPENQAPDPSFAGCLSALSDHSGASATYSVWSYDASTRLLQQVGSDEQGVADDSSLHMYWKLDAAGRLVLRAGVGGYMPFRHETTLDEHGNPVSLRALYVDALDLNAEQSGRLYSSTDYVNQYDEAGRLLRVSGKQSGLAAEFSATYEPDEQQRCKTISWNDERVERRDYDSAGRLSHRVREHWTRGGDPDVYDSVLTYQHDAAGRLTAVTEGFAGVDTAIARLQLEYRDNGSLFEERTIDTDVGDGYSARVWSAGCSELLPLLLREVSGPCAAALPPVGDFRIP